MRQRIGYEIVDGHTIFKIDYSFLKESQFRECVFQTMDSLQEVQAPTCFYIDVSQCEFGKEIIGNLKEMGKQIQPKVAKTALVGLSNNMRPFLKLYLKFTGSKLKTFETHEMAMNYLCS
jgi:hypothetical protein